MKTTDSVMREIKDICTYHGDEGTSGYCLSNEQFGKLEALYSLSLAEARREERERILREIGFFVSQEYTKQSPRTKYVQDKIPGMMHPTQVKILEQARTHDFGKMTLREIGGLVGVNHPQKIDHHLKQLRKKGFIK